MRKQWQWPPRELPPSTQELARQLAIHPALAGLLHSRGIQDQEAAQAFFSPSLDALHNPFLLKDMNKAVNRLLAAREAGEKVLLYGDYDVDGTCCIAMLYDFLSDLSFSLDYYIPNRHIEGYGLSLKGIEYAREQSCGLIISLDCGIRAVEPVAAARAGGMDVIICDHHLPGDVLPDAHAILNPKQLDCPYPFDQLSACGVAYKWAQAIAHRLSVPSDRLESLLDLVALSTASDIVPLQGENRILAHHGLRRLNRQPRLGVKALIHVARKEPPLSISDLVFGLGPRLNAAGRMADAALAVRLLLSADESAAHQLAGHLDHRNEVRKKLDRETFAQAQEQFESEEGWEQKPAIVLAGTDWHKGILGIVASRLSEYYHRPAIVLTEHAKGQLSGSGRSVPGIDLCATLSTCAEHLGRFGGHQQAVGLQLDASKFEDFRDALLLQASRWNIEKAVGSSLEIAAEVPLADVNAGFYRDLQRFAPFGPGNPRPLFASRALQDSGYVRVLKNKHLKFAVSQDGSQPMDAIAFGQADRLKTVAEGDFSICYVLEENRWKGRRQLQLRVRDILGPEDSKA
ncbi:MAG: single-stranded-DNA-specific exonuclease RecJ [Bacteroidota bacterium]